MATLKELQIGRSDVFMVDPSVLQVRAGWNSREDTDPANLAHIESLSISIAQIGVQTPLVVFHEADQIWVVDGHCRLAATRLAISRGAEIKAIPVKTGGRGASEGDRLLLQVLDGKAKTPLEQGRVFKRLIDFGWTEAEIAEKSGYSRQHIVDTLDLNAAPKDVRQLVEAGSVSSSLATQVLKADGEAAAGRVLRDAHEVAKARGKSRATAKDLRQVARPSSGKRATDGAPASLKAAALDLFVALTAIVEIARVPGADFPDTWRPKIEAAEKAIAKARAP